MRFVLRLFTHCITLVRGSASQNWSILLATKQKSSQNINTLIYKENKLTEIAWIRAIVKILDK
tara:strand:+ start:50192 stop:50380 length:189 start_codon:yes stop_codon:yes gene_type:complete